MLQTGLPCFHFCNNLMKQILLFLIAVILGFSGFGCGGGQQKGKNRDKDKPKPAATLQSQKSIIS